MYLGQYEQFIWLNYSVMTLLIGNREVSFSSNAKAAARPPMTE